MSGTRIRAGRTKKSSLGGRILGALFGIGLFFGSFALLWFNEGRLDYGEAAKSSQVFEASQVDPAQEGQFVAAHGALASQEQLGDPLYLIPGNYLAIERVAEMYAWDEDQEEDDDGYTYYKYNTTWTANPSDSNQFHQSYGHENPAMPVRSESLRVQTAALGAYQLDPAKLELPTSQDLGLNKELFYDEVFSQDGGVIDGKYVFFGTGTLQNPVVGDLRIHFRVVTPSNDVTLFGQAAGDRLVPYTVRESDTLYRAFYGDRESAIEAMHTEYQIALWGTRFGGFAMMWCGLFLLLNPITILVAFIPALERFGAGVIAAATMPIAFVLSAVTILLGFVLHNPLVLIAIVCMSVMLIAAIAGGAFLLNRQRQNK